MAENIKYPTTARNDCICNLCQNKFSKLSEDHVPPKSWMAPRRVKIESYPEGSAEDIFRSTTSHNGLKFKTLCSDCNNILGARYDKALKNFTESITQVVQSPFNIYNSFSVETQPALIVKAILGHILAAKTGECNTSIDEDIRRYVLGLDKKISSKIKVYYWYFPYDTVIISLDKIACDILEGGHAHFSVLKYYPVAFLMMYESSMSDKSFCELTKYIRKDECTKVRIPFRLNEIPATFPESSKYSGCCLVPKDHTDLIAH